MQGATSKLDIAAVQTIIMTSPKKHAKISKKMSITWKKKKKKKKETIIKAPN